MEKALDAIRNAGYIVNSDDANLLNIKKESIYSQLAYYISRQLLIYPFQKQD